MLVLLLPDSAAQAKSFEMLNPVVRQGDVLIVRIFPQWQGSRVSIALFGKHYLPNRYGEVFIGIDKNIAPGKHIATLVEYGRGVRLSWDYEEVEVVEINFPARRKVPGRPRDPDEIEAILKAYKKGNGWDKYIDSPFTMPLDQTGELGTVTSPFGGENHRGVDLKTLDDLTREYRRPVKAINSGVVVLVARNFSLEGNMVIIDHGSGIFSLYMHLSKLNVKEGQAVKGGEVIGISGKSGRISGPHLHFAIRIGDPNDPLKFVVVDPVRFIEIMNQNLK